MTHLQNMGNYHKVYVIGFTSATKAGIVPVYAHQLPRSCHHFDGLVEDHVNSNTLAVKLLRPFPQTINMVWEFQQSMQIPVTMGCQDKNIPMAGLLQDSCNPSAFAVELY